jgi:hypothetical protein
MMKVRERVLVLSLCLIVVVAVPGFLYRLAMDQDSWRPNDIYNSVGGSYYSSASVGSSSSDGVVVSVRGGARSSRRVAAPAFSYARNAKGLSAIAVANSQSPIANSQGLYTTSSHMAKSFGSGLAVGNVATSHVTRNAEQSSASSLSVPSFVSYSASEDDVYAFASQSVSSVSVSEMTAVGASAAPAVMGVRAMSARRLPSIGGMGSNWDFWLSGLDAGSGFLYGDENNRYYDMDKLHKAFVDAQKAGNFPGWTWERFLAEYFNAEGQDKHHVPLGEAWVLLAMALVYVLARLFKSCRLAVNN